MSNQIEWIVEAVDGLREMRNLAKTALNYEDPDSYKATCEVVKEITDRLLEKQKEAA